MKYIYAFTVFLLVTSSLFAQEKIDLKKDTILTEVFSTREIKGLETIVDYADKIVLLNTDTKDISYGYHLFIEKMSIAENKNEIFKVDGVKDKNTFFKNLDKNTFNAIWLKPTSINGKKTSNNDYRLLDITTIKSFGEYLKKVGAEDGYYAYFYKSISNIGSLTLDDALFFYAKHKDFDFDIPKNRLWAAIFVLTREYPEK
tara:strand:- start:1492 stop:2094 length:603 start_codon:yes stop_codon:yes gene_type:complete